MPGKYATPRGKAATNAKRRYSEKKYDRLYPFVPKGRKAEIQAEATAQGETLNEFIIKSIDARIRQLHEDE